MKGFDGILITAGEVIGTLTRFTAEDYAEAARIEGLTPGNRAAVKLVAEWRRQLEGRIIPAGAPTPRTP